MSIRQLVTAGTLVAATAATVFIGTSFIGTSVGSATAQTAQPPVLGTLTFIPATGLDLSIPSLRTSAGCSADANGYNVIVTGPGGFAEGFPVVATTSLGFSATEPIDTGFNINMRDAATLLSTTIEPGEYPVTFNCIDVNTFDVKGTFVGRMFFTTPTNYQTTDPNAPPTGTTTTAITTTTTTSVTPTSVTSTSPRPTSSSSPSTSPTSATSPSSTTTSGPPSTSSVTATNPPSGTIAAAANAPISPTGGNQAISVTAGALGNTGGPTGIMFIGGLILIAAGLLLIIAVRRFRQDLR
ncbi:MAG: hypothetical protein ACT4NY_22635 [Pseudonocardiales bacterium]